MLFYISILIFFIASATAGIFHRKFSNCIFFGIVVVLSLVGALRYQVGFDFEAYWNDIHMIINTGHSDNSELYVRTEMGSRFLMSIAIALKSPQLFFFITSVLTIGLVGYTIFRNSPYKYFSFYIFLTFPLFYLGTFTIIRQWVAVSIIFFSIEFLLKRKYFIYLVLVGVASSFHLSALVAILLIPITVIKPNEILLISTLFLSLLLKSSIPLIVTKYLPFFSAKIDRSTHEGGAKAIYIIALLTIISIVFKRRLEKDRPDAGFLITAITLGTFIYISFSEIGQIGQRLSLYFTVLLTLITPLTLELFNFRIRKYFLFTGYLFFAAIFLYSLHLSQQGSGSPNIPYKTFLFK